MFTALRKDKHTKDLARIVKTDDLRFLCLVLVFPGFQH